MANFSHSNAICGILWLLITAVVALQPNFSSQNGSFDLQNDITTKGLMDNLQELHDIASENGGNRAFGLPGFEASRDFILEKVSNFSTANVWVQHFPALFHQVESVSLLIDDDDYRVAALTYSPSTSEEGVTAPLIYVPGGNASCAARAYEDLDVDGKIVLTERGPCPDNSTFAARVRGAATAGAVAVIFYNNSNSTSSFIGGSLTSPNSEDFIPSGMINSTDGRSLVRRLKNYEEITASFQQTQIVETRTTQNIFAETHGGDPSNVIMLGAHLDSVQAGPGINDDGSGCTLILEIFTALQKYKLKNKVRVAWWGAEENGKLGSNYYTTHLAGEAINDILLYLNFDMVSRGYFGVFDGDGSKFGIKAPPGSEVIQKLLTEELVRKGINVTSTAITGGSDYAGFFNVLKKPIGGLHTGTGPQQDSCYHKSCDTIGNVNPNVLTTNAKAAAHVVSVLAMEGHMLIPKTLYNATSRALWTQERSFTLSDSPCAGHD